MNNTLNIITVDPSLISTAMVVNGKLFNYCRESSVYGKKGMTKWFKLAEQFITYRYIDYRKFKTYSEGEITKLNDYDYVSDLIIKDILDNIDTSKESHIKIEGYSFGSSSGDIIDLVTFSTLLRKKLYDKISKDIIVFSPSTLKQESCKLTYDPIDIGVKKPKLEYRNKEGVAGGKFTKREIYLSLIENDKIDFEFVKHLKSIKEEILEISKVPKPYEDINDAFVLYLISLKEFGFLY